MTNFFLFFRSENSRQKRTVRHIVRFNFFYSCKKSITLKFMNNKVLKMLELRQVRNSCSVRNVNGFKVICQHTHRMVHDNPDQMRTLDKNAWLCHLLFCKRATIYFFYVKLINILFGRIVFGFPWSVIIPGLQNKTSSKYTLLSCFLCSRFIVFLLYYARGTELACLSEFQQNGAPLDFVLWGYVKMCVFF